MDSRTSPLARYLLGAYALLVVYASLHPFHGWRDQGVGPFDFLNAPLIPRYYTGFDLIINALAYLPFGALIVLALYPRARGLWASLLALCGAATLSFMLEATQTFLPARIPSSLDWLLNCVGAALGAGFGVALARTVVMQGKLRRWRDDLFVPGKHTDVGLVLLAGWLLSQLNPETLLFGNGDLRELFESTPKLLYPAAMFVRVEAIVTAAQIIALALLVSLYLNDRGPRRRIFLILLLSGCIVRTLAFALLFKVQAGLDWLTPGAAIGLIVGTLAAMGALALSRRASVALCGTLLMAATALVNLAPDNPYLLSSLQEWRQGHFLNFNGFTKLVSVVWPFAVMGHLLVLPRLARTRHTD
ncbi:MAG TPA: VanZ family protein [Burkholderiales bacterium]|nr:VanZ family protein [Burkholderiales bacterium]